MTVINRNSANPIYDTITKALAGNMRVGQICTVTNNLAGDGIQLNYEVKANGSGGLAMANGNELVTLKQAQVASVANLNGLTGVAEQQISLGEYDAGSDVGGGTLVYDATLARTNHNGGTIFSPARDLVGEGKDEYLSTTPVVDTNLGVWVRLYTDLFIEMFGGISHQSLAGADTIVDSYASFAALIAYNITRNYFGEVFLGKGYFRCTQTVLCPSPVVFKGTGPNESYIHADHLTGPGVHFQNGNSGFRNLGCTASATRRAGAYGAGLNFGVLYEGTDVPEASSTRLLHSIMDNFYLFGHPEGLMHIVGPAFTGLITSPNLSTTKGHGITFDRGEATGRVNPIVITIGGVCNIIQGRINLCGGHAIAAGSPTSAFSTPALRIVIDNVEGGSNATDVAVRFYNSPVYLRGANHVYENSGLAVDGVGGNPCAAVVAGRNIHLRNNRLLADYEHAYQILTYDELPTDGIYIDGFSVINPSAPLAPAVLCTKPGGETIDPVNIFIDQGEMANITEILATDATLGSGGFNRVAGVHLNGSRMTAFKTTNSTVNNTTTVLQDAELRTWLAPLEEVMFECTFEYDGTNTADIRTSMYGPSGVTLTYATEGSMKVGTTDTFVVQSTTASTVTVGSGGIGVNRIGKLVGYCKNGVNAGYLGFAFAQLVAEVSDTRVLAGISNLKTTRIHL